ncbi:hypothetical protein [Streptomyces sp. NBC_01518]|uniref:hypothetical protein n=1 Tax=Streptomyces sp. NBC_01518 TaxID=2903891 RepID=UPI00386DB69C
MVSLESELFYQAATFRISSRVSGFPSLPPEFADLPGSCGFDYFLDFLDVLEVLEVCKTLDGPVTEKPSRHSIRRSVLVSTQAMAVRVGSSGTEATSRSLFLLARVDGLLPGDRGAALASAAPPCGWAIIAFGDLPSFQLRAPPTASRPVTVDLGLTNRRGTAAHTAAKPPIPIPTAERLRPTLTVRPGDLEGLEPTPETTKSHPISDRVGFRQLPLSEPKDSHCGGPVGI